jgi:diguanylate cyclase (GGDEF)-like protein
VGQVVNGEVRALYVVRVLKIDGTVAVLFCELDQSWLWQGIAPARVDSAVAVLDAEGRVLQSTAALPAGLLPLLRTDKLPAQQVLVPVTHDWSNRLEQWRGVIAQVQLDGSDMVTDRWSVISYRPLRAESAGTHALGQALPLLAGMTLAVLILTVWYLRSRWEPVLQAMRRSLADLAEGRYVHVQLGRSADSPRQGAMELNRAVTTLQRRVQALASMAEIDRLLLQPGQLELSLDHLLLRICNISACHSSTLALLDPDAQGYARSYAVAVSGEQQPVNRVAISPAVIAEIAEQVNGLTVINTGGGRYGFLDPLRALGAEFFWVWPVLSNGRPVAILSVGYLGVPEVPPELASFGAECAVRLGVALSNSARDEELYRRAHFDPLTALPNRQLFRDRLAQELAGAGSGPLRGALLYIDLDQFKKVNDTVGHAGGDQLLQIVGQRLRGCVKDGDTVARLSGDEFTVVLRAVGSPEAVRATAARIVDALQMPVAIAGRDHQVRASVGVTMFPDDGTSIEELTRNADLAMYQAKEGGRGRVVFYSRSMESGNSAIVESSLLRGLRKQEFLLHYQPQYKLSDGSLVGIEALLRWQPPRQVMRYPGEFINVAEESGLIVELGEWVLDTACEQMAIWRKEGIAPPRLSINVSVYQLRQPDFPTMVRRAIDKAELLPEMIELEITESVFADDEAREALQRLAAVGVRLTLDDFGTGYSSLGLLREHPVQAIKIDRSFVEDVIVSPTAATLAETIISMAHTLGKQVVAEGVETLEQLEFLRRRNCDLAQGFFFSKPRNLSDITEVLVARAQQAGETIRTAHL